MKRKNYIINYLENRQDRTKTRDQVSVVRVPGENK